MVSVTKVPTQSTRSILSVFIYILLSNMQHLFKLWYPIGFHCVKQWAHCAFDPSSLITALCFDQPNDFRPNGPFPIAIELVFSEIGTIREPVKARPVWCYFSKLFACRRLWVAAILIFPSRPWNRQIENGYLQVPIGRRFVSNEGSRRLTHLMMGWLFWAFVCKIALGSVPCRSRLAAAPSRNHTSPAAIHLITSVIAADMKHEIDKPATIAKCADWKSAFLKNIAMTGGDPTPCGSTDSHRAASSQTCHDTVLPMPQDQTKSQPDLV